MNRHYEWILFSKENERLIGQNDTLLVSLNRLEEILGNMQQVGGFRATVLASTEGLPIASVSAEQDGVIAAAMAALLQRVSREAKEELRMDDLDEVMLRTENQTRLVSRYFDSGDKRLILAVLVPKGHPYRRLTNRAIREIQTLLSLDNLGNE
jgi:predicted regulator of Ras-like GTPase activity (Roadblock/LC7/MglB family)